MAAAGLLTLGSGWNITLIGIVPERRPPYALAMAREKICKKCLVEHDEAIHEATVSIHEWLRDRVRQRIDPPVPQDLTPAA